MKFSHFLSTLVLALVVACSGGTTAPTGSTGTRIGTKASLPQPFAGDSVPGDSLLMALDFHDAGYYIGSQSYRPTAAMMTIHYHPCLANHPGDDVTVLCRGDIDTLQDSLGTSGRVLTYDLHPNDSLLFTLVWVFGTDTGQQVMAYSVEIRDTLTNTLYLKDNGSFTQHVIAPH